MGQVDFTSVKLVIGGSIVGDDKGTGTLTSTLTYFTFGGAADKWGTTPDDTDINAADFGVVVSFSGSGYILNNRTSHYAKATNFGFSIPAGATIDGIKAEVKAKNVYTGAATVYLDHIRITVYYTEAGTNMQVNIGDDWKAVPAMQINIGDAWKAVEGAQINIGDAWKTIF